MEEVLVLNPPGKLKGKNMEKSLKKNAPEATALNYLYNTATMTGVGVGQIIVASVPAKIVREKAFKKFLIDSKSKDNTKKALYFGSQIATDLALGGATWKLSSMAVKSLKKSKSIKDKNKVIENGFFYGTLGAAGLKAVLHVVRWWRLKDATAIQVAAKEINDFDHLEKKFGSSSTKPKTTTTPTKTTPNTNSQTDQDKTSTKGYEMLPNSPRPLMLTSEGKKPRIKRLGNTRKLNKYTGMNDYVQIDGGMNDYIQIDNNSMNDYIQIDDSAMGSYVQLDENF